MGILPALEVVPSDVSTLYEVCTVPTLAALFPERLHRHWVGSYQEEAFITIPIAFAPPFRVDDRRGRDAEDSAISHHLSLVTPAA